MPVDLVIEAVCDTFEETPVDGLRTRVETLGSRRLCARRRTPKRLSLLIEAPTPNLTRVVVEFMDGNFEKRLATSRKMEAVFFLRNLIVVIALLLMRRTEEAQKNAEAMLREGPEDPFARIAMALVLAIRGDREKSLSMLTPEVEATAAADLQYASWMADVYALVGDAEKTASWLRIALSRGYLAYPYLARHDWFLDGVRSTPEVRAVLDEIRQGWEQFRE